MRATCAALRKAASVAATIAERPIATQVVGHVVEQQRRIALDRVKNADHGRKHFIVNDDGLGGGARLLQSFGNDEADRIADVAHFPLRQGRMRRFLHRQPVLSGDTPAARQTADAGGLQILASDNGENIGHRQRRSNIDRLDVRMRVRRTNKHTGDHIGPLDVGDVIAATSKKATIFLAQRPSTNPDDV